MLIYLDTQENYHLSKIPGTYFKKVDNDFESFCDNLEIKSEDVLFINSEMLLGSGSNRQDLKGILLLKWLRISKRCINKIIVCGFLPLQNIIEKHPEHVILLARGTTYLQFPFNLSELDDAILKTNSIENDKLIEYYRPFIKADFNIGQMEHSFANEFGLLLMQSIHELISGVRIECDYSNKYNTLDFDKAEFLYFSETDRCKPTDDQEKLIEKLLAITVDNPSEPKKVLYIDDQADLGWSKLFAGMIFNNSENINLITIPSKDVINEKVISQYINEKKPSCVLLDLRLRDKLDENISIEEISGYKILNFVKNKYPSLPVIITSATNKAESLNALMNAGAESLWTKPRVENIRHTSQLYDSYFNLLNIVYEALTKFKTVLDKTIFELDYHRFQIPENFSHVNLQNSLFIFDTNYFICKDSKYSDFKNGMIGLIKLHNLFEKLNLSKRILLIGDVLSELNKKSMGVIKTDPKNYSNVKMSAKFSIELLLSYLDEDSKILYYDFENEYYLKNSHITYFIDTENKFKLFKQQNELVGIFRSKKEAEYTKNELLDNYKRKTILHADDTFKLLIYDLLCNESVDGEIRNIYLICDDQGCKNNVLENIVNNRKVIHLSKPLFNKIKKNSLIRAEISYKNTNLFLWEATKFLHEFNFR